MILENTIKNGITIRIEFTGLKMLLNKMRAKINVGTYMLTENGESLEVVGVSIGYWPSVSYDVHVGKHRRLDERRESALLRLIALQPQNHETNRFVTTQNEQ